MGDNSILNRVKYSSENTDEWYTVVDILLEKKIL